MDMVHLVHALDLAKTRRGFCAPNPSVGAVITDANNHVIATGYHSQCGAAHAEIDALSKLNGNAAGATIFITLEPCCHFGRTPPCTDALIQARLKRVVYAYHDPNPLVSGKSESILRAAGIDCEYIPLSEINFFYQSYQHWQQTQKPFVTAKIAMTLDGKIAEASGRPLQITGEELAKFTHCSRKKSDALLTTAKTIICDDPQMNVRYQEEIIPKKLYVLDTQLSISDTARIFSTTQSVTLFHDKNISEKRRQKFIAAGTRCIGVDVDQHGLDLHQVLEHIGRDGIHDLWVEAGGTCFSAFLKQGLLQRAYIYLAPKWIGEGINAMSAKFSLDGYLVAWKQYGKDVLCEVTK